MRPVTTLNKKPPRQLTRKQRAFVDEYVKNPKASATEIVKRTYNTTTHHSAEQIAFENLRKPEIVSELAKYNNLMENTLINTVNDWGKEDKVSKRSVAVETAKYIHDKIHGKAIQRQQVETTAVRVTLDLTGE